MDDNSEQLMRSCDEYWKAIADLPAADAQYVTLIHLWTHARYFIQDENYELMLLRALAFTTLVREGCPQKEILSRVADRMYEIQQQFRAEEQRRKLEAESGTENVVPFLKH